MKINGIFRSFTTSCEGAIEVSRSSSVSILRFCFRYYRRPNSLLKMAVASGAKKHQTKEPFSTSPASTRSSFFFLVSAIFRTIHGHDSRNDGQQFILETKLCGRNMNIPHGFLCDALCGGTTAFILYVFQSNCV